MKNKKQLLLLFLTMMKIGAFTFGGGYAMISLLQNEFVNKKKWMEEEEFLDMVAIAESTPGPIAINSSTYIGNKLGGFFGAFIGTLGMVIPSFTIIYIISLFLDKFLTFQIVANAFQGIRACVVFLILSAGMRMFRKMKTKNALSLTILGLTVCCMVLLGIFGVSFSSIFYILASAVVGLICCFAKRNDGEGKK